MIRIALIGDVGSGKSYISKLFGYPVFNADKEVSNIYKKDKKCFFKLKKKIPNYFLSFPIKKKELVSAILNNKKNLKLITKIVHPLIRKKLKSFTIINKFKKIIILDIPLLLENKINKKGDILIFVQSKKLDILKRLKKRKNFNPKLLSKFKNIQLPLEYKKKKSQFIIKNNFTKKSVKRSIKKILKEIL